MKVLFLMLFVVFGVGAQEGIICYNLDRNEMIEFQQNAEEYTSLIRGILVAQDVSFVSFIIQSGDTFVVNMIGLRSEDDVIFLYDSSDRIFKVTDGFTERVLRNVEMIRLGMIIKLNKFDTPFVVYEIDDIFSVLGIRGREI